MNVLEKMKILDKFKITPVKFGIIVGIVLSVVFDLLYVFLFHESSSGFYLFAGLILLGCPLIGGIIAVLKSKENKRKALLNSSSVVFVIVIILSFLSYAVLPVFFYDSVQVPASGVNNASNSGSHLPSYLNYTIPGVGTGTLLTNDTKSAVVVMANYSHSPFNSTVFLVNKSNSKVLQSLKFNNDIIAAAIDNGTLILFNDKLGYFINTNNGEFIKYIVKMDNYRGLYTSNNGTYMQTDIEMSAIYSNGSVVSHRQLNMSCIAYGYLIS